MRFVVGQALRSTGFYHYEESNKLRLQMVRDYENVVKDDNRFQGEWSLALELAQHQPWAGEVVSFTGGREILKIGVENPEPTAAEELLTDLKGGSSLRMLVVGRLHKWILMVAMNPGMVLEEWSPCFLFCKERSKLLRFGPCIRLCASSVGGDRAVVKALKKGDVHCTQGCGWSGMRSRTAFDKGIVLKWFALRHMPRSGRRPN